MRNVSVIFLVLCLTWATACRQKLLDERFYDDRLGNWTALADPDTLETPPVWQVEKDGWLHQRSNAWGRPGDFLGRWYGTLFVAGDTGWADYRLSVKAKPGDDDGFGVVFRFNDPEKFYRLLFIQDGLNGGPLTRLDKRSGADYTELWSTQRGYRLNEELFIEVEVVGEMIRASVNGTRLFEVQDGTYRRGKIGLFCYAQNGQAFDDVTVAVE